VRLLGQVCVERRGTPGRLARLHCWLTGPHTGCAHWRGWVGWAGSARPHGNGERGRGKGAAGLAGLGFQLSFGPPPSRNWNIRIFHHPKKIMHRHEMQQVIIYLNI
jgi:hypothetical protein